MGRFLPTATGSNRPRLCKNVFQRDRYSKPDWKSRFYAKSTSADVPINFRFNVDAHISILAKRFYTLWAKSSLLCMTAFDSLLRIEGPLHFAWVMTLPRVSKRDQVWPHSEACQQRFDADGNWLLQTDGKIQGKAIEREVEAMRNTEVPEPHQGGGQPFNLADGWDQEDRSAGRARAPFWWICEPLNGSTSIPVAADTTKLLAHPEYAKSLSE